MEDVRNTRLLTYDIKVSKTVAGRVRWYGFKDSAALCTVIYNLIACIRKGQVLIYSRNTSRIAVSKKAINARRIIKAVDFLVSEGYIENFIGRASHIVENRSVSYMKPTQKFLEEWNIVELYMQAELDHLSCVEAIVLRDSDKKAIPYRNSEHIARMSETVRNLNRMNESAEIRDAHGNLLTNIYARIFNETFEYGGRFYRADVLSMKNKTTNDRLKITIDSNPVCEVDFSNLHFRIAAALEDLDGEDIPLDIYSGILEDENNVVDREIVKLAVNMMFNCYDEGTALKAIQKEINTMDKGDKINYSLGNAKSVMALIYEAYPQFVYLFCSEKSFGRVLQNADSHLASDIIQVMLAKEIPCLPVHDSFIVSLKHLDLLCDTMGECFRKRFDWSGVVPVGLKYFLDGDLVSEKICV